MVPARRYVGLASMKADATMRLKLNMIAAASVKKLSRVPTVLHLIRWLRCRQPFASLYQMLLGYHRPFATLREAARAVAPYYLCTEVLTG
jgi:hypothetical protein